MIALWLAGSDPADDTYDAANQIATWGGTAFTYDLNNNLTNDGTKTYTWNARNQLTALSGGANASFQYDGLRRRRAKIVGGASTGFLYDGLNEVQELVGGSPSANILPGLGIDEWLTRTDGAGARHFLTDALGSAIALADGSGAIPTMYTYEPFGKTAVSRSVQREWTAVRRARRRRRRPLRLTRPVLQPGIAALHQ